MPQHDNVCSENVKSWDVRDYYDVDDILVVHLSDKPIVREVSQDWHTHVSYAADGSTVELVLLDARANGAFPFEVQHARAA